MRSANRRLLRGAVRRFLLCLIVVVGATGAAPAGPSEERRAAIERALAFLYATASDPANLNRYGSDLLWCFYTISHTARDRALSAAAGRMGRDLAKRWRLSHRHVPRDAGPREIYQLVAGAYSADRLGLPAPRFKAELRAAARRFTARDYLGFDAPREPPRPDDPRRYDLWTDALITTYFGDAYGIRLGAPYRDVLKWLPRLRPYDGRDEDLEFDAFNAATHVIYTLNRYHERRVAPSLLPEEFAFIRRKLDEAIEDDDPETAGEALDCLKAAGFEDDPQVDRGMAYLVASQRPDGAWAGDGDDVYTEYHSAWTAIDGLRDYRFRGEVKKLPVGPLRPLSR
jgi:hypothetical protein